MGKQLSEKEEAFLRGLMLGNCSYRSAQDKFLAEYGRQISPKTIKRVKDGKKKIKKRTNQNPPCASVREDRIISKVIKNHRWES